MKFGPIYHSAWWRSGDTFIDGFHLSPPCEFWASWELIKETTLSLVYHDGMRVNIKIKNQRTGWLLFPSNKIAWAEPLTERDR